MLNSKNEYIIVLLTSILVSMCSFVIYKLILIKMGSSSLEEFSIIKRYQSFFVPVLLMGMAVTIPKFIVQKKYNRTISMYVLMLIFIFWVVLLMMSLLYNEKYYFAMLITAPALIGSLFYSIARGLKNFKRGALVNLIFFVFLPLVAFYMSRNLEAYLYTYTITSICLSLIIYLRILHFEIPSSKGDFKIKNLLSMIREGVFRVPGDIFQQIILITPLLINEKIKNNYNIGYLALALSIAQTVMFPIKPISTILLVKATENNIDKFKLKLIFYKTFAASIILCGVYYLMVPPINKFYFDNIEFKNTLESLIMFVFFYAIFILLRSYADAIYDKPVITYATTASFCITFPFFYFGLINPITFITSAYCVIAIIVIISLYQSVK